MTPPSVLRTLLDRSLPRRSDYDGLRSSWRGDLLAGVTVGVVALPLALGLWAIGRPELYLLWIGAWLTTNMLFSRLRQAAEHAVVPDLFDPDPRLHTRTTMARRGSTPHPKPPNKLPP